MSKLTPTILLSALLILMVSAKEGDIPLHGGQTKAMFLKMQEEGLLLSAAIKNLKIMSPRDTVEMINMANEFTNKMQSVVYAFNQAIPNVKNLEYKKKLEDISLEIIKWVHLIQSDLTGDVVKLQETLSSSLSSFERLSKKGLQMLIDNHKETEPFLTNQVRKGTSIVLFAIYKLKTQTTFFNTPNKDLEKEIESEISLFIDLMGKIELDDADTKHIMVRLVQHLKEITEKAAQKLENWMQINSKETESLKIVKDAAETLSDLFNKLHLATTTSENAGAVMTKLKEIVRSGTDKILKLADVEIMENRGDQEFIRSLLLDAIAMPLTFKIQLGIFFSTKNMPSFV